MTSMKKAEQNQDQKLAIHCIAAINARRRRTEDAEAEDSEEATEAGEDEARGSISALWMNE